MPATGASEARIVSSRDPLSVQILLFDGFDLLDALGPYEAFQAAGMLSNGLVRVELVSPGGARSIRSGLGGPAVATDRAPDVEKADILLVPGAAGALDADDQDSVPAVLAREASGPVAGIVREALDRKNVTVATVCGGSLILAMAGLVGSRPAVTHHLGMQALAATGAAPIRARVVDDGTLVTSGGVTSGIDLALHLVERELGPRLAHAVETLFEHERRGVVWRSIGHQPIESAPASETAAVASDLRAAPAPPTAGQVEGMWDLTIFTPIGRQQATYQFRGAAIGLTGTAAKGDETTRLDECRLVEDRLSWTQKVQRPMKLILKFELVVRGDEMNGAAKAGLLPASRVVGRRRRPAEA
ncbi:MAG: DJ-1/PfpI family protein [Roseiarcus sp.]|jgi:transcriptional regulator GlxA family with amidase domain